MEKNKIIFFGGTFNPIHYGHLIMCQYIAEYIDAKKIYLVPNGNPPHKKDVQPIKHKIEMLKLAISDNPIFNISLFETQEAESSDSPSYTINTIRNFTGQNKKTSKNKPYWIIGPDNLLELNSWYKIQELVKECNFIMGYSSSFLSYKTYSDIRKWTFFNNINLIIVKIPTIEIRSSIIRERIQKNLSIKYFVPESVEKYIISHELYKGI